MVKKQLHSGAKWLFRLGGFFGFLFFAFFLSMFIIPFYLESESGSLNYSAFAGIFVFVVLFLLILVEVYARMAYNRWFYEFTDDQLRVEKGIIWKRYSNVPYQRIQNVDITRGIIARICGFSSVNIQTAGYSVPANSRGHSEGYLPAVDMNEAEKIREFLMKKINKKSSSGL
jgi:putative membrane protein